MAEKILKFKKSDKSKYERVNRRCDDGDYVGALSSLLYTSESEPKNVEVLCHIADVYTELGLYENAIVFWFKFLSKCRKSDMIDGYNGLGANYFFLDDLDTAGYYFNKQLSLGDVGECVYDDILDDYVDAVTTTDRSSFKVISKESDEAAKEEENYRAAAEKNKSDDYIAAIEFADKVSVKSEFYGKALYEKAYAYFCLDREFDAVEILKKEIDRDPGDINAYNLMFNCLGEVGDNETTEKYFEKLIAFDTDDVSVLNKKMSVLSDFGFYDEALKVSDKILRLSPEDTNCTYLRGLILYNKGEISSAVNCLKKAYLYSLNPVALYYMRIAEKALEKDKKSPKMLPLIFELQKAEVDKRLDTIKKLFVGEIKLSAQKEEKILDLMKWVFSCGNQTAQMGIAVVTVRSKKTVYVDFIKEQLVNPSISDDVKQRMLALLTESLKPNEHDEFSVVYSNVFKKVKVVIPDYGADVPMDFRQAYAYAVGRTSLYFDKEMKKLTTGAVELEADMRRTGAFGKFTDMRVIACAMFVYSGINRVSDMLAIYGFFDTKREDVVKLIAFAGEKK